MKFLITTFMLINTAIASEITVLDNAIPYLRGRGLVDTSFYMDTDTNQGYINVSVTDEYMVRSFPTPCGPTGMCFPTPMPNYRTIFNDSVKVDGLELVDSKIIYHAPEGVIECGTLGVSRVFRRPTIYLSGNCSINAHLIRTRNGDRVVVDFITK